MAEQHPTNLEKMIPQAKPRGTPLMILVGADKGGVGKTTVSRALNDYLLQQGSLHKVFDSEFPKGDLIRFVPNASIIDIQNLDDQMRAFDTVDSVSLIDVRASMLSNILKSLGEVRLLDDVRSGALNMAVLHVIGPSVASLTEITEIATALGAGIHHFLVKNFVNESGFEEWQADPRFAAILADAKLNTITIPHMPARACTEVQQLGVSFEQFTTDTKNSRMLRGYVQSWLDQVYVEFERVGLKRLIDEVRVKDDRDEAAE